MAEGADLLAHLLTETAGRLARETPRQPSTSVPPVQVDLTRALKQLHDWLPSFYQRIVPGEVQPGEWQLAARIMEAIAAECRRQEPPDHIGSETS